MRYVVKYETDADVAEGAFHALANDTQVRINTPQFTGPALVVQIVPDEHRLWGGPAWTITYRPNGDPEI